MSTLPDREPECSLTHSKSIELLVEGRPRDLGGFSVRRVLPSAQRRLLGPFIFFDQMGPAAFAIGSGIDVRPHPHIGLATVTYLFEGEIEHRDSLGSMQVIRPGDVNWMLAGRGIAHSERTGIEQRRAGARLHGIQSWVALPFEHEEAEPSFEHHPAGEIPKILLPGAVLDVVAGTAYGRRSPVEVRSPTLYVHANLDAGASLPIDDTHEERGVYVAEGAISFEGRVHREGTLLVLRPAESVVFVAETPARLMLVGGAKLPGERFIYWNFVSSSLERIEAAKRAWKKREFPPVVGDEQEFIPLPEA
ncbi:MAG TPA: pirin family protein [Polyangiaceae bacterium]